MIADVLSVSSGSTVAAAPVKVVPYVGGELAYWQQDLAEDDLFRAYGQTGVRGVFAAGDATDGHDKQVVIAVGEGAKAALAAAKYLVTQV